MTSAKKAFLTSEEASTLRAQLQEMVESADYNTTPRFSTAESGTSEFVQRHMDYMSAYLSMDHVQYVRNLKLMTRI